MLTLAFARGVALGQTTYNYDGPNNGSWDVEANWFPAGGPPDAGDTAIIFRPFPQAPINVRIDNADAVCEILQLTRANLLIKGQRLTLGKEGDCDCITTSTLDKAEIQFEKDGTDPAELAIRNTVTFESPLGLGGIIKAFKSGNADAEGFIIRHPDVGEGIKLLADISMKGSLTVLVDVNHQGLEVGVSSSDDTMFFGDGTTRTDELEISGSSLNGHTITASDGGKIEFDRVKFLSTAPKWVIDGPEFGPVKSRITVRDTVNDVPNDIELDQHATLNIQTDVTFTGKLTFGKNCKVRVKAGKVATFDG